MTPFREIFFYDLIIELGMRLISAFPVDTITPMFFMHINPDALLCLLVLVKKRIERQNCHIIIMGSISLCCDNSISDMFFLEKLKPSQTSNDNPT